MIALIAGIAANVNPVFSYGNNKPAFASGYLQAYPTASPISSPTSYPIASPTSPSPCITGPITVTNTYDSGTGSLRQAIADICPGGTVNFAPSLSGQTITLGSSILFRKGLTIDGSNLSTHVKISGGNTVLVFSIQWCTSGSCSSVTLQDLDIVNANSGRGSIFNQVELNIINTQFYGNNSSEGDGGAISNYGILNIISSSFVDNHTNGGGGAIRNHGEMNILGSVFFNNSATYGGSISNEDRMIVIDSTFANNNASTSGGAIYTRQGSSNAFASISESTFVENSANVGGGIYNALSGILTVTNSTFTGNTVLYNGAGILNETGNLTINNSTFANNTANGTGGGIYSYNSTGEPTSLSLTNTILANSTSGADCYVVDTPIITSAHNLIEVNGSGANACGIPFINSDPNLGPLADNGGFTQTMALQTGSPAIDAGDDVSCESSDQRWAARPQGQHCDIGAFEYTNIKVDVAGINMDNYYIPPQTGQRHGFAVDDGPVQISNLENENILTALRIIWKEQGVRTSYSEMMGLPKEQLSTEYWFPWYNNLDTASMDQGFRIANLDITSSHTIRVFVGGAQVGTDIILGRSAGTRVSYPANNGPVHIVCVDCTGSDRILAALRVIWKEPGQRYSYSEMMGLPKEQLSTEYWFPWYNNLDTASMDQGFRIANVDNTAHTIQVFVGGTQVGTNINLGGGASTRVSYPVNNGPVRIYCATCNINDTSDRIIATLRVIWQEPEIGRSSYSEMMGLPKEQLSTEYWFPWYNNLDTTSMDQGFRIANVNATSSNTIEVWVGNNMEYSFSLGIGESVRKNYPVNNGPIHITCSTCTGIERIIASLRVIWQEPGERTSYSEMMGLPVEHLSLAYWFPWYNNAFPASMDQGLRISVP